MLALRSLFEKFTSARTLGATGATVALALLIGCGGSGGGGGGGTKPTTTTTSSSSSATTSTATTAGVLPENTILYAVPNGNGTDLELAGLNPDDPGSSSTIVSDFSSSITLYAANPNVSGQYVIAYDPSLASASATDNGYGIYISTGLSTSSPKQLVAPTYTFISSLSITDNGKYVVYSATDQTGASSLFAEPLAGGTPVNYGLSDGSTISPADDDTMVYVAIPSSGNTVLDQVYTRSLKAGVSGAATQITGDAINHALPAISRDGTQIAYWEEGTSNNLLVQAIAKGSATTSLLNPSGLIPQGEVYSGDGSSIAIAAIDANDNGYIALQTPNATSTPSTLLEVPNTALGNYGIYWTSQNGRGVGGTAGAGSVARRRMAIGRALRPALHIR